MASQALAEHYIQNPNFLERQRSSSLMIVESSVQRVRHGLTASKDSIYHHETLEFILKNLE